MKKPAKRLTLAKQTVVALVAPALTGAVGGATLNLSQCGVCPPTRPVSVCTC